MPAPFDVRSCAPDSVLEAASRDSSRTGWDGPDGLLQEVEALGSGVSFVITARRSRRMTVQDVFFCVE